MKVYRPKTRLPKKLYNFKLHQGGIGDLLGQLPAIKFVLDYHVNVYINLWVHAYAVDICKKVFEKYDDRITIDSFDNHDNKFMENLQTRTPYTPHLITNLSWHITEQAFATIVGRSVPAEYMNYIKLDPIDVSSFNLPKNYAVITTGYTSDTRVFKAEYVNEISDYLNSIRVTPVFLGKKATYADKNNTIVGKFEADYTKGIDLIDQTDLFQAHAIISEAACAIGLDNGLVPHLAGMTSTPIVVGFTSVDPLHRLPYRENKIGHNCYVVEPPEEKVECRFCQSNMNFADPSHSFMTCAYQDFLCVQELKPELWIEQIKKALEPKTPQERAEQAYQSQKKMRMLNQKLRDLWKNVNDENLKKMAEAEADHDISAGSELLCTCNGRGILENHDNICPLWELD